MRILLFWAYVIFVAVQTAAANEVWYDSSRRRNVQVRITLPNTHSDTKYPVILFSHGIGSSIDACTYLSNAWTAQGFACVFVQHSGSDENIWKGKIRILKEYKECFKTEWNSRSRAEDLRFVLDCLEQSKAGGEAERNIPICTRLDFNHIGVGGIDLGALAAMLVAGQTPPDYGTPLKDDRITAVVAMSPVVRWMNISFKEMYKDVGVPVLFITGTEDDGIVGPTKAEHRRIPFDSMTGERYLLTLKDGGHRIYGGRVFSIAGRSDDKFQAAIVRYSTVFWAAALQKHPDALQLMNTVNFAGIPSSIERRTDNAQANGKTDIHAKIE